MVDYIFKKSFKTNNWIVNMLILFELGSLDIIYAKVTMGGPRLRTKASLVPTHAQWKGTEVAYSFPCGCSFNILSHVTQVASCTSTMNRVRIAQLVAYGSANPKVLIRINDSGSNPTTTHWFCVLLSSSCRHYEKLLGWGYAHSG